MKHKTSWTMKEVTERTGLSTQFFIKRLTRPYPGNVLVDLKDDGWQLLMAEARMDGKWRSVRHLTRQGVDIPDVSDWRLKIDRQGLSRPIGG